jgi:hypothetical protein
VFLVLFTLITVLISLKTAVVHRVEGVLLHAVLLFLLLRIAWWFEMYWLLLCCGLLIYQAVMIDH